MTSDLQDEKQVDIELKVKVFDQAVSWEKKVALVLDFINSNHNIQNICQLVDISASLSCKGNGEIVIYYYNKPPSNKQQASNSPVLECQTNRRLNKSCLESASMIKQVITEHEVKHTLFKINMSRGGSTFPITFVWHWNIKPEYKKQKHIYDETDHILRNHGNNVATIDKGCYCSKGVVTPMAIFQNGYNMNTLSYVGANEIMQINFDRAYILNTFRFLLYDTDGRVYKYKLEISKDALTWKTIANDNNKSGWTTVQFDEQFVKHLRFVQGSNTTNQYFHICKFYAFFDYSLSLLQ
eukprot:337878_1